MAQPHLFLSCLLGRVLLEVEVPEVMIVRMREMIMIMTKIKMMIDALIDWACLVPFLYLFYLRHCV
jgi:hypothetical protein